MRPLVLVVARRVGLKAAVIFGTIVSGLQYPLLPHVQGFDLTLALFIFIASVGDTFYWTTYHAYFATVGDAEHRGHQISAREALRSSRSRSRSSSMRTFGRARSSSFAQ
mgnify:CR=1 FL=1